MKITVVLSLGLMLGGAFAVQAAELWKHDAPDNVQWKHVSFGGNFLYGTDGGIYSLDPATGKVAWKREDLKKVAETNIDEIEGTPVLLVSATTGAVNVQAKVTAIDLTSGETLWETEKVKGQMADIIPIYKKDLVVIVTAGGGKGLDLLAVNLASGKVVWESNIPDKADLYVAEKTSKFFPKLDLHGHARPTVDDDAIYFAYSGIHKVDLATGNMVWKLAYDVTEKSFLRTNAQPIVGDTMVFTSGKGVLRGFDKQTGALKWTSADFGTGVAQMELVDGVLYGRMGGVFQAPGNHVFASRKPIGVVALEANSGQLKWKYEGAQDSVTNMLVLPEDKALLVADAKNLIGLGLDASGNKVREAFKVPLEFKPKGSAAAKITKIGFGALKGGAIGAIRGAGGPPAEPPVALLRRENGLVVIRGTQNLLAFNPKDKEIAWSARIDPPGLSTFNKIATAAAFAMVYAAQTAQAANTYYGTSENDWANASRRKTAEDWERTVSKRYKKTTSTNDYVYMLSDVKTSEGKGPGIVGVNLSSGEQERTVYFGDREPEYVADEVEGIVFRTHKNGKTIIADQVK